MFSDILTTPAGMHTAGPACHFKGHRSADFARACTHGMAWNAGKLCIARLKIMHRQACLSCRTRFYRAELRGTAAWEHDLEQGTALGHPQLEASMSLGTAQSLGPQKSFASGLMRPEMSSSMKAWGSASFVMAPDGTPILPSATSIRPKAKVKHVPCLPFEPLGCLWLHANFAFHSCPDDGTPSLPPAAINIPA